MDDFRFEGSKAYFDFSGIGEKSNITFMGEFCVKTILSPIDHLKSDQLYRELIGPINPHLASQESKNFAFALSQLKQRILEAPDFFKNKEIDGGHLDANILIEIINLSIDAETAFSDLQNKKVAEMQDLLAKRIRSKAIAPDDQSDEGLNPESEEEEKDITIDLD